MSRSCDALKWRGEDVVHAAHLRNITNLAGGRTPWELMKGEMPDISTAQIIGAPCMVKVPAPKQHKLAPKSKPGRLLF
jgi:hypothetical protein